MHRTPRVGHRVLRCTGDDASPGAAPNEMVLPADVIAHVGSFLDINTRLACVAASATALASINYGYTHHVVRMRSAGPDLRTHLPFIKRIKPSCKLDVRFEGLDDVMEDATLASVQQASDFANAAFAAGRRAIFSNCSVDAVKRALPAFGRWQLDELHISLRRHDAFTPGLVAGILALVHGGGVKDLSMVLWDGQADVLSNAELARAVRSSVDVNVTSYSSHPVNLEHVRHVRSVTLSTRQRVAVRAPQNLTLIHMCLLWRPDEDGNPLIDSFRGMCQNSSRMERVIMEDVAVGCGPQWASGRHWLANLTALKGLLPAACEYYYGGETCNPYVFPTLRELRDVHARVGLAYHAGDDEFLVSRAIQLLLPGIPCICPAGVEERIPAELQALGTLTDVHSRMSPEAQRTWFWLPLTGGV